MEEDAGSNPVGPHRDVTGTGEMGRRGDWRRYARELALFSPPAMVAAVTERRRAGDWRGACAAARVDVHIDLRHVAARFGTEEAARIEADLRGFAPDLLRRFLPRVQGSAEGPVLLPQASIVLSRRTDPFPAPAAEEQQSTTDSARRCEPVPVLIVETPRRAVRAPQRLTLRVGAAHELTGRWYDLPDWCWHADAVAARRWAYGASATRLAWHTPDGTPHRPEQPGTVASPADPTAEVDRAAQVETIDALLAQGRLVEAYRAAGCDVELNVDEDPYGWHRRSLIRLASALPVITAEVRRLSRRYGRTRFLDGSVASVVVTADDGRTTVRPVTWENRRMKGPALCALRAPREAALLSHGLLTPDDLHPLVHEALFPARTQSWRVPSPPPLPVIRVRCGGDWHTLRVTDGRLVAEQHTEEDLRRELLLAGLGGPINGCATAVRAWRTGARPMPKRIRLARRDVFGLARHGDTDTLLALLSAGFDPSLRDGTGGTLMHWLPHLDHTRVLPLLLSAGLSVDERDRDGDTPLHRAARVGATEVMSALVEAGADPRAPDASGRTPADILAEAHARGARWPGPDGPPG